MRVGGRSFRAGGTDEGTSVASQTVKRMSRCDVEWQKRNLRVTATPIQA